MHKVIRLTAILVIFLFWNCTPGQDDAGIKGQLMIIGGGKRPERIMKKFVELSGGANARIAVIPTASSYYEDAGRQYKEEFQQLGADSTLIFNILSNADANNDSILHELGSCSGFFFGGGDQNKLTSYFLGTKALELLHSKYKEGASIGGTSAGAAIMSSIMITGDGNWTIASRDSIITAPGFGFVQDVIIDQHFFRRQRFNRLLNTVIQNRVDGIGIDEGTAIWVKPSGLIEVLGESTVIYIQCANAVYPNSGSSQLLTATNLILSVYKEGDIFRLHR